MSSDGTGKFYRVHTLPTTGERQHVGEILAHVAGENYDEIVVLGFKDGRTYLNHSRIANEVLLIGAIEVMKLRMITKGE